MTRVMIQSIKSVDRTVPTSSARNKYTTVGLVFASSPPPPSPHAYRPTDVYCQDTLARVDSHGGSGCCGGGGVKPVTASSEYHRTPPRTVHPMHLHRTRITVGHATSICDGIHREQKNFDYECMSSWAPKRKRERAPTPEDDALVLACVSGTCVPRCGALSDLARDVTPAPFRCVSVFSSCVLSPFCPVITDLSRSFQGTTLFTSHKMCDCLDRPLEFISSVFRWSF